MDTHELLKEAWEKIKTANTWTQGTYARNKNGYSVVWNSPDAVCWCSLGALRATASSPFGIPAWEQVRAAEKALKAAATVLSLETTTPVNVNDALGRAATRRMWLRAIKNTKGKDIVPAKG